MMDEQYSYFVIGRIILEGKIVENVKCKIYLSNLLYKQPHLVFLLNEEQHLLLSHYWKGSFEATQNNTSIFSENVYFKNIWLTRLSKDLVDCNFEGEPVDLKIIENINASSSDGTDVVFYLSDNKALNPLVIEKSCISGVIKRKIIKYLSVTFYRRRKLLIKRQYFFSKALNNQQTRSSILTASAKLAENDIDINADLLPLVDDILLLLSLATKQRTACLKWSAKQGNKIITFYRSDMTYPDKFDEENSDYYLIDLPDLQNYINKTWSLFKKYPRKEYLRGAIYALIPGNKSYLGQKYLSLFSGLEMLLLDYRKTNDLEFIIEKSEWCEIKRLLKKGFKEGPLKEHLDEKKQRRMLNKINELNRVSLQEVWNLFIKDYELNVETLWPVFSSEVPGLSNIRNWLIHGQPIPKDYYSDIVIAKYNLEWILERAILCILHWNIDNSMVCDKVLQIKADVILMDTPAAKEHISRLLKI